MKSPESKIVKIEPAVEAEVVEYDDSYEEMTKPELEAELVSRGLSKYGNKPELIARLQDDDV